MCVLTYRPSGSVLDTSEGVAILLVVKQAGSIAFYVSPDSRKHVSESDWVYIDELLKDLVSRASVSPGAVFEQLSELSVGPLRAGSVREVDLESDPIASLYAGFIPYLG